MIVKKSNYGMLFWLTENEAMKTRSTNSTDGMWFSYVPELNEFVAFKDDIKEYIGVNVGFRLTRDMLDRKQKFKWNVEAITENEHFLISETVRIYNSMENLKKKKEDSL